MKKKLPFVSYAQNGEDVVLHRALREVKSGFYIDVGAADPDGDSVTKAFYERGWSGINIEPNGDFFTRLEETRTRDVNIKSAVASQIQEVTLEVILGTGLSTLVPSYAIQHRKEGYRSRQDVIHTLTLDSILAAHPAPTSGIQFLKVDVEGFEKEVLLSIDLNKYRPWIIVYEATRPNSNCIVDDGIPDILERAAYAFVFFDGVNKFFLAKERYDLVNFIHPVNCLDNYIRAGTGHDLLQQKTREVQELTIHLEDKEKVIKDASNAYQALKGTLGATQLHLRSAQENYSVLEKALEKKKLELDEAQIGFSKMNDALRDKDNALRDAGDAYRALQLTIKDKDVDLSRLDLAYKALQSSLEEKQKDVEKLLEAHKSILASLAACEHKLDDAQFAYDSLMHAYSEKDLQLAEAGKAYKTASAVISSKEKDLADAAIAFTALQETLQATELALEAALSVHNAGQKDKGN